MKELEDLNPIEKNVLIACCDANNFSLNSHIPREAIRKRINLRYKNINKYIKRSLHTLLSNGFIREHPTRGNITYQLNKKGLKAGIIIKNELEKDS